MTQTDAMILEDLIWDSKNPMDNPPVSKFKYLEVGDTFTFKGDKVTVTKFSKDGQGFFYEPQFRNPRINKYYMTFSFFLTTPHFKGKYKNRI